MTYLIGADVGSSALKAALVHPEQGVVAISEQTYPMHRPHPDWAENDADDWYRALARAIPHVLSSAGVSAREVSALCLVGQRDIAVLLDEAGRVLAPVIHWTDRRDPEETSALYDGLGREALIERSGTLPIPGLVLANLTWTRRHQPEVWRRVRHALQPKDYLAYRLIDDVGTDPTGPTRSVLNDWRTGTWSPESCAAAGIPCEILPDVRYAPWEPRGELGGAAHEIGLLPGTVLVAGGGDDPAAALGSGVIDPGDVSIGTGSSMSWRAVDSRPRFDPTGIVGLMPHVVPDRYLHEMVAVGSGTTLRWLRSTFGGALDYAELIAGAREIARGSDGLLCFPYVEGATVPVQDDQVRAAYHGISGHHRLPHFVRATLEGIAYQYPALLDVLRERGLRVDTMTISDGEARSSDWNQIKADVLDQPLVPALRVEAPSIGAAILAGLGTGAFSSARQGVDQVVEVSPRVEPAVEGADRYRELRRQWEEVRAEVFPRFRLLVS
ncbi:xylulokinase [Microbispora sp. H10949]|uniref:xylulokinase n=1 Tax=Microbispora sp. H10949 TaxID=2729111 RepID=UPI0015FEE3EB|nr:FGGY family carbohydrate kinase [Microbispora sp. H10949]